MDSEQDEDDLDDDDRDRLVDQFTGAQELDQLRLEIAALKELVEQARKVRESGNDSKLSALRECLSKAQFAELKDGRGKLLIFTEHRDTGVMKRWSCGWFEVIPVLLTVTIAAPANSKR